MKARLVGVLLEYLVTDGRSFTDLQERDMSYRVVPDPTGTACTIVATPRNPTHDYACAHRPGCAGHLAAG